MIVGPMTSFPNVILNTGFGPCGYFGFASAKIIESLIFDTREAEKLYLPQTLERIKPQRLYV
jgi:hypothetical protein